MIFGDGRKDLGNPMLANQVLIDHCLEFPECQENKRVPRGKIQLTRYVNVKGFRNSKTKRRRRRKMDYEAFVTSMQLNRGLPAVKSDAKWRELDTPQNYADDRGPAPHTKRLKIPPEFLCLDDSESAEEAYEDRSVQVRGQEIKNANDETKQQLLDEMGKGFSSNLAG